MPNYKTLPMSPIGAQFVKDIKQKFEDLENFIKSGDQSRELSLAITNLEQACMWAVKHAVLQDNK